MTTGETLVSECCPETALLLRSEDRSRSPQQPPMPISMRGSSHPRIRKQQSTPRRVHCQYDAHRTSGDDALVRQSHVRRANSAGRAPSAPASGARADRPLRREEEALTGGRHERATSLRSRRTRRNPSRHGSSPWSGTNRDQAVCCHIRTKSSTDQPTRSDTCPSPTSTTRSSPLFVTATSTLKKG